MSEIVLKVDKERVLEMPMVDLAFELLKAANKPYHYKDLIGEIAKVRGLNESELTRVIAQVYTEINIDGRFASVGNQMWGLKRWYPVEKSEDPITSSKRAVVIHDEDDDLYGEEEEAFKEDDFGFDVVAELFDEDVDADDAIVGENALMDDELGVADDSEEEEEIALEEELEDADFEIVSGDDDEDEEEA